MIVATTDVVTLNYSVPHLQTPPVRSDKFLLLTIGGVICTGPWQGALGERYLAWALMPKTDKVITAFIRNNPETTTLACSLASVGNKVKVTFPDGSIVYHAQHHL